MIGWSHWYRLYQEGRKLNNLLFDVLERGEQDRSSADRYRTAWMSARRRADNYAGSVVFWKQLATERFDAIQKLNDAVARLNVDLNDARLALTNRQTGMSNPVPAVTTEALGSRDRANLVRLSDENERLRAAAERCEKEHR